MKLQRIIIGLIVLSFVSCDTKTETTEPQLVPIEPIVTNEREIIFKDSAGHSISRSDLANITGKVNYEIMDDKTISRQAQQLHEEARALGQTGKYDLSIAKLEEAIKLQPDWAYPVYDLAFTHLLKGNNDKALTYYKKTDEMEPRGFFTAKTAVYSLEGEKTGKFPKGLYATCLGIEWESDPTKKMEIAKAITEKYPDYAPAWKELSSLVDDNKAKLDAIEKGLSKNPDAETKGILEINKALIWSNTGKKEEAKQLLGHVIFSQEATMANVEMAKFALKSIIEK
ncbi:MAG: hypothetical protein K0S32_1127 [Bacteroidetes bacterium]|jgi:tetratricopeptide (TPR) repeat protein|nr:hypothetical protein [Bacteroidota bacterium]